MVAEGPASGAHAVRSGLACDLRQVPVSRRLGFLICREGLPSRKREALCAGLGPEQDLVPDHHGNSTWSHRCGHPSPDSPSLSFRKLIPGPYPSALALNRKPWRGPRGPSQPACFPFSPVPRRPPYPSTPRSFSTLRGPSAPTAMEIMVSPVQRGGHA